MKTLNLAQLGVTEMRSDEVAAVQGGWGWSPFFWGWNVSWLFFRFSFGRSASLVTDNSIGLISDNAANLYQGIRF